MKKVNITRDLESRKRIARIRTIAAKVKKPEKETPQNEPKTQTEDTPEVGASGRDKKPGRKAEGKP